MNIIRSLVMLTLLPCLVQCREPVSSQLQNAEVKNPLSCPGALDAPDIAVFNETDATDAGGQPGIQFQYVVTTRDSSCRKRQVLFKGCGEDTIKNLFGYVATKPRTMTSDEIRAFEEGDQKLLPAFNCSSGFEPRWDEASRPAAVHATGKVDGFGALQIDNPQDSTRPTYVVVPNSCFALGRKLEIAKWVAKLERPDDALLPFRPEPEALTLQFSCAHEKKPELRKEGWLLSRSLIGDQQIVWYLRYLSKEPGKSLSFMIYRLDGQDVYSPELASVFEQQMIERLGIKPTDIAVELLGTPDEKTLLFDYCTNNCESFVPQHIDVTGEPVLNEASGEARLQLKPVSSPFLEDEWILEMKGQRALKFRTCDQPNDDFRTRLGFKPMPKADEPWEMRLKKGAENSANFEALEVPCFQKKPVCLRTIPAGTDLSTSMTNTPGSISSYVTRPRSCSNASELELRLEGDVFVRGNALTLGNTSQSGFSRITLTGQPRAKITLDIDCSRITCDQQTLVAVQIVPNTVVELKGLQFATQHDPLKVKTMAIRGVGTAQDKGSLRLRDVGVSVPDPAVTTPTHDFHTGLWLENLTTYAASLKVESTVEAIHGQGGQLSLIGQRNAGQIRANDNLSLKVLPPQIMDGTARRPSLNVLRVLNLTDVRTFLYATQLDGPMAMELQTKTDGPGTTTSWYLDVSNSYALYKMDSAAILTKGAHKAHFYFPWVHDIGRLVSFGGSNRGQPQLMFDLFVESSFVFNRDMPIENDYRGQINGASAAGMDVCRNQDDWDDHCLLSF